MGWDGISSNHSTIRGADACGGLVLMVLLEVIALLRTIEMGLRLLEAAALDPQTKEDPEA
jgi:hypothetical protein